MAENAQGYIDIPEADRKKAKTFFDRGKSVADTGNYEYAIEMYLQGLAIDPDAVDAHQAMREISLKRKAGGGKGLGMLERMKGFKQTKDDKQNMLAAERLLAFDPGNTDHMLTLLQSASKLGFYDTVMWIGAILVRANSEVGKPDFNKFIILKNIYKEMAASGTIPRELGPELWRRATEACQQAAAIRPDDMDIQTELKNLGALHTMDSGGYQTASDFRGSIRDMKGQQKLLDQDKDVRSVDVMKRMIADAEAELKADPNEPGKLMKLVETLVKTEQPEEENRAIELLDEWFGKTKAFRYRLNIGKIRMAQLSRMERSLRAAAQADPKDAAAAEQYRQFVREKTQEELNEYTLWAENYPTDTSFKYEMARRMFMLEKFDEAIPVFQTARNDPKYRQLAAVYLGRSFLEAGYVDEAVETLKGVLDEYQVRGDERSKQIFYWYARALEQKGDKDQALKAYSQVAQWDFNFRDVQQRVKKLRPERKGSQA